MRNAYLTGKIWNVGDIVEANGAVGEVVRKGTNYLSLVTEDGKVHKAWLHDIELDERNYAKEYANYHSRPEQRERNAARLRARRRMEKLGKVKKFDDLDVHHKDNNPLNNEEENLEVTTKKWNRTEPRLRGKELDEEWWETVIAKLSQITHPKGYGKMVRDYAELVRQDKYKEHPNMAADKVARSYRSVNTREFRKYINKLVAKKVLPQELKAEYEMEEAKSPTQKLRDFDKSRTAVGKKPIFKDKGTKFVRMKKKGQMTIMNVPSDEVDKYIKKGYKPVTEEWSFKDFVHQIQEKELTDTELKRREEIAKDLSDDNFKKKYGDRWKEVKMGVATKMAKNEQDDPCWDGYKQIGMKKKDGKKVPNCVPEEFNSWGELIEKAEHDGRSVDLNNPTKGDVKKYKVYVKNDKGNVVKVEFGDPNMEIKRDDPKRRKSFRARHGCDNPGPKWKAKYWSCKFWSSKSVTDLMKG